MLAARALKRVALLAEASSHRGLQGFVAVLEDFDELLLDVPDATAIMALFIGRAVTDEILPPNFIERVTPPPDSNLEALKKACVGHLKQPHGAERLLRCWGSGVILMILKEANFCAYRNEPIASPMPTTSGRHCASV